MKNCAKTTLLVNVNANLPKLGEMILDATPVSTVSDATTKIQIRAKAGDVMSIEGNGYYATTFAGLNDPSQRTNEPYIFADGTIKTFYFKSDTYKVHFISKYDIQEFKTIWSSPYQSVFSRINLSDFRASTGLFNLSSSHLYGDIANLHNTGLQTLNYVGKEHGDSFYGDVSQLPTTVVRFLVSGGNLTGNSASLSHLTSLIELGINLSAFTKSPLETLVSGQYSKGRTTCESLKVMHIGNTFTFGQNTMEDTTGYIAWESSSKMCVYIGSAIGTSTKVYCKGYTQQEAETKWSGKTIVRVDA